MMKNAKERGVTKVTLWSDNAGHFHSGEAFIDKGAIKKRFGIDLNLEFFEAGEGKSDLDRHFGCLKRELRKALVKGLELKGDINDPPQFYFTFAGTSDVRSVEYPDDGSTILVRLASGLEYKATCLKPEKLSSHPHGVSQARCKVLVLPPSNEHRWRSSGPSAMCRGEGMLVAVVSFS